MIMNMKLGNYAKVQGGYAFKSSEFINDAIPIIRIGNLDGEKVNIDEDVCYPETFWDEHPEFRINKGDILVAMSGATVGKIGVYESDDRVLLNQRVGNIQPKENILRSYLYFYCMSPVFKRNIELTAFGAAQPNISAKNIEEFGINVPSIEEQRKASLIMEKTLAIINAKKKQLGDYDLLIKSRFVEMFGDPVSNPLNWREDKLSNIGTLGRGVSKHRPRNAPELLGGEYPLIQTGDVANSDLYITEYRSTYSEIGLKQSKMWDKGTLCITIAANIAKTSILSFDACFPDSVVGFDPSDDTNNVFMHYWFAFFQQLLESQAPESAQKNINLRILSDLNVIVPPKKEQDQFENFVHHVDKLKFEVQKSLDENKRLFDSLMQEYFE